MRISIDTETTGLDIYHGCQAFLVTTCDDEGEIRYWEWLVNPHTRKTEFEKSDLREIRELLRSADEWILHNAKFDLAVLREIGLEPKSGWPWDQIRDTLFESHMLRSNQAHDLTTLAIVYLRKNIKPFEDAVEKAVKEIRGRLTIRKGKNKQIADGWRIAEEGLPEMPSAKEQCWRNDYWLPAAYAEANDLEEDHPYRHVTSAYANTDSAVTLALSQVFDRLIIEQDLIEINNERRKLIKCVYGMEQRGIKILRKNLEELETTYREEAAIHGRICRNLAASLGHEIADDEGRTARLSNFILSKDGLNLPVVKTSKKTGEASLDKVAFEIYLNTLPKTSKAFAFVSNLLQRRKRDTALQYIANYRRFAKPIDDGCLLIHPSLNPTGTVTLRFSSSNPNEQNISKKEGFNLRYAFGPGPDREWWALDYENIELRIPAYEAGEQAMVDLFERPDDPPYFGSNHLLAAHVLHEDLFNECLNESGEIDGREFKKRYPDLYKRVKAGNFAVQYGAMEQSGTADRAYGVKGGQRKIQERFTKIKLLNESMIAHADRKGYVETMRDFSISARRGYPLHVGRTAWGKVEPTTPLNYHVQGTAMWCTSKAMARCEAYLEEHCPEAWIALQVHDEIVFDFPAKQKNTKRHIENLCRLMEKSGDDIGVPLAVSVSCHPDNWSEGLEIGEGL